ncbi:MAG: NAD(P)/FAD-dependent oxidoreductase [Geminicoccaceae bacterium]
MKPGSGPFDALVLGAGAIGTLCALELQRRGLRTGLIDRDPPGAGTSSGNAGVFARGAILPVSTPAMWRRIPHLLVAKHSPLTVRWRHMPARVPWLVDLWRAQWRWQARIAPLDALLRGCSELHGRLMAEAGLSGLLNAHGWLYLYDNAQAFADDARLRRLYDAYGIAYEVWDRERLYAEEPALGPGFSHGLHHVETAAVRDPRAVIDGYARLFVQAGGTIVRAQIEQVVPDADTVRVVTRQGAYAGDQVVLALGAFSGALARRFGARVRLDTERGYHAMLALDGPALSRPVHPLSLGFVMAPQLGGIRLTSGDELGGLQAAPRYGTVTRLIPLAQKVLPGLAADAHATWMGYRPSTPDSLPVIGHAPADRRILFAYGHGHLGLTLAPRTGQLIGQLATGQTPNTDLAPYAADRGV